MPTDQLKLPNYGGQALIEGVLMRGSRFVAAAFRAPDGQIITHTEELEAIYKSGIRKIPFLRGLLLLWDALGLGMRFLTISANIQVKEDNEKLEGAPLWGTIIFSLGLGISLFFLLPAAIGHWSESLLSINGWISNIFEGLIRLLLVVGYIWGVGKIPDIARVFAYHGAEHKTINAFEAGAELTPEIVGKYSLEHPRCGTAFLLTLIILSIIVFSLFGPMDIISRLLSRLLLLPLLAGAAYEYIRFTANHMDSPLVRLMVIPNLSLQHLTTRQPDAQMLEVAIMAFKTMLAKEQNEPMIVP
ncbi:MAG TPA: DUF1385 domain-containing protein [Anaerolineaceae bacterium]